MRLSKNSKLRPRNGLRTAIVCKASKGQGAFSDFLNRHKVAATEAQCRLEEELQTAQREERVKEFRQFWETLEAGGHDPRIRETLRGFASRMHLDAGLTATVGPSITARVPRRDKRIRYDAALLPRLDPAKQYSSTEIVTAAMKVFARDPRVVSIDSDLASTSGLQAGVGAVDQNRALNVGVAEANMMGIGEAFAALGFNTWVSTFCPFFDWKVLRRIAVGHQERSEAMEAADGWLSEGHGLDLTFLATGANSKRAPTAPPTWNDQHQPIFDGMGHLKIVDVSCPRGLLAVMQWIMAGNPGLMYVRANRSHRACCMTRISHRNRQGLYSAGVGGRSRGDCEQAGGGVYEALAAAGECARGGLSVGVVDMPSVDEELMLRLHDSGKLLLVAEQNNGFLWQNFLKVLYRRRQEHGVDRPDGGGEYAGGRTRWLHPLRDLRGADGGLRAIGGAVGAGRCAPRSSGAAQYPGVSFTVCA